jgi:hypothetical protein
VLYREQPKQAKILQERGRALESEIAELLARWEALEKKSTQG